MQTSILLAKLIGPVLLVMGMALLINRQPSRRMARELVDSDALIFLSGAITLPVGLAIVVFHNVWVVGWPVIITIFGWIAVAVGIARMVLPGAMKSIGREIIDKTAFFVVSGTIMAALGAYLSYQGYLG